MTHHFPIFLADSGFCGGVNRADVSIQKIRSEEKGALYIYGELIHNSFYNTILKEKDIHIINSLDDIDGKIVIIRTHGIPPTEEKHLYKKAKKVYDLTCPLVKSIQKKAYQLSKEGYFLIITGSPNHPEVLGIKGYTDKFMIIQKKEDLERINRESYDKVALISQSTFSQDVFIEIMEYLETIEKNILIINTLCHATTQRQDNAEIFGKHYDMVIVIGGKNSSNTKKVFEKAKKVSLTKQVFHIEHYSELMDYNFSTIQSVAISSGTSTPVFLIKDLIDFLEQKGGILESKSEILS